MTPRLPILLIVAALVAGCQSGPSSDSGSESPTAAAGPDMALENRADSVAMEVYEALGGPETWRSFPYLRFTFAVEQEGNRNPVADHFWNRQTGQYRVEWSSQGGDTTFVALFDVDAHQDGEVYANGTALEGARASELLDQGYRRFINDTYWLLAPVKMLDPGVHLEMVADSTTAVQAVLHASFGEDVGITSGDQYWFTVDRETHRMTAWAYHLQGYDEEQPPSRFRWTNYQEYETPSGPVWMAPRKQSIGGGTAILTDSIGTPASAPENIFSDPSPRL